jgi:hypothetical protein
MKLFPEKFHQGLSWPDLAVWPTNTSSSWPTSIDSDSLGFWAFFLLFLGYFGVFVFCLRTGHRIGTGSHRIELTAGEVGTPSRPSAAASTSPYTPEELLQDPQGRHQPLFRRSRSRSPVPSTANAAPTLYNAVAGAALYRSEEAARAEVENWNVTVPGVSDFFRDHSLRCALCHSCTLCRACPVAGRLLDLPVIQCRRCHRDPEPRAPPPSLHAALVTAAQGEPRVARLPGDQPGPGLAGLAGALPPGPAMTGLLRRLAAPERPSE